MSDNSKFIKIAIVLFAAALLVIAAVGVYTSLENQAKYQGKMTFHPYYPGYDEIISRSDLIVTATVTNQECVWDTKDGKKPFSVYFSKARIYTEYTFESDDILKGNETSVKGRVYGGSADGYTMTATGTTSFEVGDKVLLFLTTNQDESGNLISWYHIGLTNSFFEKSEDVFMLESDESRGDVTIEQLREDIIRVESSNSESRKSEDLENWDGMYITWDLS